MTTQLNARVGEVTNRIVERSRSSRQAYLARIDAAVAGGPARKRLGCANFAHGFAACAPGDKEALREGTGANLAIVTAYNDMLSAHQPYARFPDLIKEAARAVGASAQVAGGVPAMCDGVTQGEKGMELSLFSRDVIALSTAVALSHNMFDAAVYLGICDKIVPGLLIGALAFGHLPAVFLPAGPMPSGLANDEKSKIRQLYAEGKATRADLLAAEAEAYHAPGTCTFDERNAGAETAREVARPDPGREDHLIGLSAALIGHDDRFAVAGKARSCARFRAGSRRPFPAAARPKS